jgi:phosphate:Na+ symporter
MRGARNPAVAVLSGVAAATLLQSSTAAALLLVSFAERGLIALAPALAVMLGADIGSTVVVQVFSFDLAAIVPILLIAGVAIFTKGPKAQHRQVGRILIGLGLMIVALKMVVAASGPLRGSPVLDAVLSAVASDPLVTVLIAAGLTWLVHSSVATILFFMALATSGAIGLSVLPALVLGVNIGAGLIPLGLASGAAPSARRILYGNLAFRSIAALAALAALPVLQPWIATLPLGPGPLVAMLHTSFNVALALVFAPLTGVAARMLTRFVPDLPPGDAPGRPLHLDPDLVDRPRLALGAASREVMRLADMVEGMLQDVITAFEEPPKLTRAELAPRDDTVDALQEAIKLYLTEVSRQPLSEEDSRRCFDLIVFTTHLEHIGDIIDKSLITLAEKKTRDGVSFSDDGWAEILALHRTVLDQMRLAVTVFVTRDPAMARDLVSRKDEIRTLERDAVKSHLGRLRAGSVASLESSAVHLDIIRDLKSINAHVASVAYPILEEKGILKGSRLAS